MVAYLIIIIPVSADVADRAPIGLSALRSGSVHLLFSWVLRIWMIATLLSPQRNNTLDSLLTKVRNTGRQAIAILGRQNPAPSDVVTYPPIISQSSNMFQCVPMFGASQSSSSQIGFPPSFPYGASMRFRGLSDCKSSSSNCRGWPKCGAPLIKQTYLLTSSNPAEYILANVEFTNKHKLTNKSTGPCCRENESSSFRSTVKFVLVCEWGCVQSPSPLCPSQLLHLRKLQAPEP